MTEDCADIAVLQGVGKTYHGAHAPVPVLHDVALRLRRGEQLAIVGPSGSGKSTLMNILGLLDHPSAGDYAFEGRPVARFSQAERAFVRNLRIGFVFQQYHLLAHLSAEQNVELPMLYGGLPRAERQQRVRECLHTVGLAHRIHHRPAELSGGERQRVAVARALVMQPSLLLADEPTGALDSAAGRAVLDLMLGLCASHRTTLVVVTHDKAVAQAMPRQVHMRDGRIERDRRA